MQYKKVSKPIEMWYDADAIEGIAYNLIDDACGGPLL